MSDDSHKELDVEAIKKKELSEMTIEERNILAQEGVQNAINDMHAHGVATVEVDSNGKRYLRHPDSQLIPIIKRIY
ncbi:hypothetical protein [Mastigocoleus sp. MO_188.B34]|uniref:hypothetical protein n=1 Tax=Mastigocoleus sp. MO_188.B34 TaxID=3036635 RepID=UPI00262246DC|nr:hypothetical protein [Mastigocoleus sp. MO_188.B34]MDJ0696924.1 hypothetical protein [Mastigocoleus sp. MO_188.B34]